jgi:Holliday junction resolvase RusA-like endonuclease
MLLNIKPVGKPRMTQRDRWAKRPAVVRYYQFCDKLRSLWPSLNEDGVNPRVSLIFYIPMPPSWSVKKKAEMRMKPHQQRPDIDNLVKAFLDALCEDDSYIYAVKAEKYWADEGAIMVEGY